jgi:hypothetical protein
MAWAACGKDHSGSHGGDLHDPALLAAVAALAGLMGYRDLLPGQKVVDAEH